MPIQSKLLYRFCLTLSICLFAVEMTHAGPRIGSGIQARAQRTRKYLTDYFAPGNYGYNINDGQPGYFGGLRYKEYYSYGRGYGFANVPPPYPGPAWLFDNRRYAAGKWVDPFDPVPPVSMTSEAIFFSTKTAQLIVDCPPHAHVWLDGTPSHAQGPTRQFVSPPLKPGGVYEYQVRVRWKEMGRDVEQVRPVAIRAGDRLRVKFPLETEKTEVPKRLPAEMFRTDAEEGSPRLLMPNASR